MRTFQFYFIFIPLQDLLVTLFNRLIKGKEHWHYFMLFPFLGEKRWESYVSSCLYSLLYIVCNKGYST